MINQLKERKEMDEAFKKAQKPWAKILQKVERTRQDYHMACKQERTAQNQERNASGDSSLSPDQVSTSLHLSNRFSAFFTSSCLSPINCSFAIIPKSKLNSGKFRFYWVSLIKVSRLCNYEVWSCMTDRENSVK